ncbi:MAG: lysophospholipid acyltransferase family protein [Pararhodobacter sp.]
MSRRKPLRARLRDGATLFLIRTLMRLPLTQRAELAGWIGRTVLGRLFGVSDKVAEAVRHFLPDLPDSEVRRIAHAVPGNLTRLIIEVLSAREMAERLTDAPIEGPGYAALVAAHEAGRPALLISGHFGNYDAVRLALLARGLGIGGFYKEFASEAANRIYLDAVSASGQPVFSDTFQGQKQLIRFLRGGGMVGILIDLDRPHGVMLDFLGQPTRTVLSIAEMALRHDALLVPAYGIRTPDAPGFRIVLEAPVPHSDPETMTQALNDSFAAQVRAHPEQWVWWHNRRKKSHP